MVTKWSSSWFRGSGCWFCRELALFSYRLADKYAPCPALTKSKWLPQHSTNSKIILVDNRNLDPGSSPKRYTPRPTAERPVQVVRRALQLEEAARLRGPPRAQHQLCAQPEPQRQHPLRRRGGRDLRVVRHRHQGIIIIRSNKRMPLHSTSCHAI